MNISENAVSKLKDLIIESENPLVGVRVFTIQSCCGPSIQMSLIDKIVDGDTIISINGVDFHVEPNAMPVLKTISIDFKDDQFVLEGAENHGCC